MKKSIRRFLILMRIDYLLALLLRNAILPRWFEKIAPQYTDYPSGSQRLLSRDGLSFFVQLDDLPDWKAYFRSRDKKRDWLYEKILPGSVIYEIGCHKGWVSMHLARATGSNGLVHAIDLAKENAGETQKRFEMNNFKWAKAHCLALSDHQGKARIAALGQMNSASISLSASDPMAQEISLDTFDAWREREKLAPPYLIKITVNGWEHKVLLGAEKTLLACKPFIMLEIGDGNLRRAGSSAKELISYLNSIGYQLFKLESSASLSELRNEGDFIGSLFDVYACPLRV